MSKLTKLFIAPFAFACLVLATAPVFAGEAEEHIKSRHTELTVVLKEHTSPSRTQRTAAMIDSLMDFDTIAKEALGSNGEGRSEAELKEFQEILTKLIKRSYERNIQNTLNYTMAYLGETGTGDDAVVRTTATNTSDNSATSIDYKLHKKNGRWMVVDIVTENVSLVNGYKGTINRTIKKDGWAGLIQKLKARLNRPASPRE